MTAAYALVHSGQHSGRKMIVIGPFATPEDAEDWRLSRAADSGLVADEQGYVVPEVLSPAEPGSTA
jgi:hypothetical protein